MHNEWEARYLAGEIDWDKGEAAPGLVDFLAAHPDLKRGTVLVPGCGTGHDVRAWCKAGFAAEGMDIAPTAIRMCQERRVPTDPTSRLRCGDFLRDEAHERFDWLFEHTLFCAIDPGQRDAYVRAVLRWLRPGGQYLAIHFLDPEDPSGPPFPVDRDELITRFSPRFALVADWIPRSYPNRTGRELMSWWKCRD